jgi:hypothetical protein
MTNKWRIWTVVIAVAIGTGAGFVAADVADGAVPCGGKTRVLCKPKGPIPGPVPTRTTPVYKAPSVVKG